MPQPFDYFVLFAEMRTGSNFLEANINLFPDLACLGEVFNPYFIAYPKTAEFLGFDQATRDKDPSAVLKAIREKDGINGFRFFHDHHAGVIEEILADPRCAKVILTRNPIESYVSWKIAQATGQWKLTNAAKRKDGKATFQRKEFEAHLSNLQGFQIKLLNALQKSGQTAFYVAYEDVQDLEVMNGLAKFLGSETVLESLTKKLKRQNPAPLSEKVENYAEMEAALAAIDRFDLTRTPNFEPRRGPVVPTYLAAAHAPLLYMPLRSGPEDRVKAWLAAIDDVATDALHTDFNQRALRQWKRQHPGHRSFTVLRHPVPRAYRTFQDRILGVGEGSFLDIRRKLINHYDVPLPLDGPDSNWGAAEQKAAFEGFLAFLKLNLGGQTAIRVDPAWATQAVALQGFADFAQPDMVLREKSLEVELAMLAELVGVPCPDVPAPQTKDAVALSDIYDEGLEAAVRDVYQRDYMTFGFESWSG
ncbi:MAG: nodulation protein NodH [Pseudomonadota bacterium]